MNLSQEIKSPESDPHIKFLAHHGEGLKCYYMRPSDDGEPGVWDADENDYCDGWESLDGMREDLGPTVYKDLAAFKRGDEWNFEDVLRVILGADYTPPPEEPDDRHVEL